MSFLWTFVAVVVLMAITFVVGMAQRRHVVVDTAWGLGFALVALVGYLTSSGAPGRGLLVTALTVVWGVRLGAHVAWRSRGGGEDPRYAEILERAPGSRDAYALRKIYLVQGPVLWFVSLPVQVAQTEKGPIGPVAWLGAVLWLTGFAFEAVGDRQLARFQADPANRGAVMDRGLWRYTRHPNYFGDACVWWGLYLIACDHRIGVFTVLSPALMTYVLVKGTGKPLLERHMSRSRPGYEEYAARTSGFIPAPPKRKRDDPGAPTRP